MGQGDAALVVTPQRQTLLIDTGGLRGDYDTGSRIVLPYLRYLGIRSLDMLLLSHGHHDHAGGAAAVAKNIPIRRLILPQEQPSADIQALLKNTKAQLYMPRAAQIIPWAILQYRSSARLSAELTAMQMKAR